MNPQKTSAFHSYHLLKALCGTVATSRIRGEWITLTIMITGHSAGFVGTETLIALRMNRDAGFTFTPTTVDRDKRKSPEDHAVAN